MRFCFIIEEMYRHETMPTTVAHQLQQWGHEIELLEPHITVTCLSDMMHHTADAYVLKTVSDGPGLSLLEAAEALGIPTINHAHSIRRVRDKAIATVFAQKRGLPVPRTYFVSHPDLLSQVEKQDYPLVVKPTNGSSCRDIYRVNSPAELQSFTVTKEKNTYFLAQHYEENTGFDVKLYVVGNNVFAVTKRSPLHPEVEVEKRSIPVKAELRELALKVGKIFDLDIYGLDVVETLHGPMIVDINDFPSFGQVPFAVELLAAHIIEIAKMELPCISQASQAYPSLVSSSLLLQQ